MAFIQSIYNASLSWAIYGLSRISHPVISHPVLFVAMDKLVDALEQDNLDLVNRLLEIDAILQLCGNGYVYLLPIAAGKVKLEAFNCLLQCPTLLNIAHSFNNAALRSAIEHDNLPVANRLFEIPAVIEDIADTANTVLCDAIQYGRLGIVNHLLGIPAVIENIAGGNNRALCIAIKHNQPEVFNRLLEFPAVIANIDVNTNMPFVGAIHCCRVEMAKRLLEFPAVLHAASQNIEHLYYIAKYGHFEVVVCLLKKPKLLKKAAGENNALLRNAAISKNFEMVKYILMIDSVRKHKSFSDLRMEYPIIEHAWGEIKKARNETKNDRKNMLMLFRSRIRQEGSISQLPPEVLWEIAAHIPTLRSKNYIYQGWKLVDSYESGNTMLLRYYDLSRQMGKLSLDEPSTSHKRKSRRY